MPVRTTGRVEEGFGWRMWERAPAPPLAGLSGPYQGYWERTPAPLSRAEVPHTGVTLILSFGDPLSSLPHPAASRPERFTSFVAGLFDAPVVTEHAGRQHGIEVPLTPAGAFAVLGVPPGEYGNRIVPLDDLPWPPDLLERLAEAPGWEERFALLDRALAARAAHGPRTSPEVARAVRLLTASGGRTPVAELARDTGWSRRHLTGRFREQTGMTPKAFARVVRFQRVLELLGSSPGTPLAEAAQRCGFYDQAHLNRDFRALAGCSPTAYLERHPPDGAFPFVQDLAGAAP
ncbi:helix-turn-helix domain-containing protein [Streptomyces sp. NPDC048172]|uniref:AraC family transcriptional regulator n=1 Tax=Streptomyces sp. NPDC048172 TaxID=3365505 RepID=UPI0037196723